MSYKDILRVVPSLKAAALVKNTADLSKKKNLKIDDMVYGSTKIVVGTSLIKTEADLIENL